MYNYDLTDLFNARNTVAIRLEEIIKKRGYTKSSLCKKAGISRPTLDKLLNGGPSSKLPYVKHITKLLGVFEITPNELMTGIEYPYSYAKSIRCLLGEDLEEISCETEISIEELKDIEAGKDVPLQDLRDLAFYLGSSVNGITGSAYFQIQIANLGSFVGNDSTSIRSPGGYWGHIGLRITGQDKYMWFPVTEFTRNQVKEGLDQQFLGIPCMDNTLLLVHCKYIEELIFLPEESNPKSEMDWHDNVNCGEVPPVVYESFADYVAYKDSTFDSSVFGLSKKMIAALDAFVADEKLNPDEFDYEMHIATLFFPSGRTASYDLVFDTPDDAVDFVFAVRSIYEGGDLLGVNNFCLSCDDGLESYIQVKQVAMIKLPLAQVEKLILDDFAQSKADEDFYEEDED